MQHERLNEKIKFMQYDTNVCVRRIARGATLTVIAGLDAQITASVLCFGKSDSFLNVQE